MQHCIVLVRPETSANIGAVCRAMATAGLSDLRIVGNKNSYDEDLVERLALTSFNIWQNAHFFEPSIQGLEKSVADCQVAVGTTRRFGRKRTSSFGSVSEVCRKVLHEKQLKAAFVFGNERTGLCKEELAVCTQIAYIPTSETFPSLNLSHAVQIFCYELFTQQEAFDPTASFENGYTLQNQLNSNLGQAKNGESLKNQSINLEQIWSLSSRIITCFKNAGFFRLGGDEENRRLFTKMLSRVGLTPFEYEHLENLITKIIAKQKKADKDLKDSK